MFSWILWVLHSSFGMTEVVVDDTTGEVLCLAGWELHSMTFGAGLRAMVFMFVMLFSGGPSLVFRYMRCMSILDAKKHTRWKCSPPSSDRLQTGTARKRSGVETYSSWN